MSFMGLEVGETACRALVVSGSGTVLARAQRRYGSSSKPVEGQLDARLVWDAVRQVIVQAADLARSDPISALAIASPGDAIVALALSGQPLTPCILGSDVRGGGYLEQAREIIGAERWYDSTGRFGGPHSVINRLCWLRDHAPGVYRETARFCTLGGFVAYQLGVSSAIDRSQASATDLLDVDEADWSIEVLRASGLTLAKMPEVRPAGTPLGPVSSAVCRELGLAGRPVAVLGADDLACTSLGVGVTHPGQALYYLGTSIYLVPLYEATPLRRLLYLRGLETWQHLPVGMLTSPLRFEVGGNALGWFLDVLSPLERREALRSGRNPYSVLLEEMPAEAVEPLIVPPNGDMPGAAIGVGIDTTRGELVRAVLEGLALQTVCGQERLLEVGIPIAGYRVGGGGSRSGRWLQLTADVTGYAIERTAEEQAAALGAAVIAAVGAGAFVDLAQAAVALVRVVDRFEPEATRLAHYRDRMPLFRELQVRCATLQKGR